MSHSSLPVALLASHPPCGSLWAAPKAPLGPRFPSGQFAALTRREKALYCPFCRRGSQRRARHSWRVISFVCARSCSPFSAVKMDGPFSLRCLSPLCSPTAGARQTQPMRVGILHCSLVASQRNKMGLAAFLDLLDPSQTASLGMLQCSLDIFATQKASVVSSPRWPFSRAMRPVAEWRSMLVNKQEISPDWRTVAPAVPRQ